MRTGTYRTIGAVMIMVSLWRMSGGGDGFLAQAKENVVSTFKNTFSTGDIVGVIKGTVPQTENVMRPVYVKPTVLRVEDRSTTPEILTSTEAENAAMPARDVAAKYYPDSQLYRNK